MRYIKNTVLALLLCIPTLLAASPASVFKTLVEVNHLEHIPLHVIKSNDVNAWYDGSSVTITTGILKIIKNDDELALILGHELGHIKTPNESGADILGGKYEKAAGYNPVAGVQVYLRMYRLYGDPPKGDVHPPWMVRYHNIMQRYSFSYATMACCAEVYGTIML